MISSLYLAVLDGMNVDRHDLEAFPEAGMQLMAQSGRLPNTGGTDMPMSRMVQCPTISGTLVAGGVLRLRWVRTNAVDDGYMWPTTSVSASSATPWRPRAPAA
jgi:hypothetical protein